MRDIATAVRRVEAIAATVGEAARRTVSVRREVVGRQGVRAGVPLVRVVCQDCGRKVASVERRGRYLMFVAGGRRYGHPGAVTCARCGPLTIEYADVEAKAAAAEDVGHAVPLRVRPVGTT